MTTPIAPPAPRTEGLRGLPALIAAQVSLHAGITGMRVVGPLILLQAGASAAQVGVLLASFAVGPIVIAWWVGGHVDARGYRPPMAVALALAFAAPVTGWGASLLDGPVRFALLCAAGALGGAAANAGLITLQRTAARMARDAAGLRGTFAWVGLAPSASNVLGPLAAGVLYDAVGPRGALLALLVFPLLAAAIARAARPPPPPEARPSAARVTLVQLLRNPTVRRMMIVDGLATGGWDAHAFFVPTLGHARGLSATSIGAIYGLFAAGVVLVRATMPWVAHRLSEPVVLTVSLIATAGVFALYPFGESAAYMAGCALALGMAIGIAQPMVLSTMHQAVEDAQRGSVIALRTMWVNTNAVALPVGLGAALAAFGPSALLWGIAAVIGSGAAAARPRR
ncbi:MAG: MFS transporter [Burkholderiales bacterium]|nr:MAG: MFS transporter [Burkholderiales bacterium]